MDYFNKSFIPLDVNGNPILSATQQQALRLEQDLEEAGFGASDRQHIDLEQGEGEHIPLLPVDKGIFRRKGHQVTTTTADGADGTAELDPNHTSSINNNGAGAGIHTNAAATATLNNNPNNTTTASGILPSFTPRSVSFRAGLGLNDPSGLGSGLNDPSEHSNMGRNTPKTPQSKQDLSEESKGHGASSSRSLLSIFGIKTSTDNNNNNSNSSRNRPLLLKNDDNFLEHRKLLVQRWKDNIDSKQLDRSNHTNNNSFYEEKEQEVRIFLL